METISTFSTETKLHLALMQTNNIVELMKGNPYESFFNNKLIGIQVELERQISLTKTQSSTKITE
jgi:hypothetical protein